jgi:hypothetical protein
VSDSQRDRTLATPNIQSLRDLQQHVKQVLCERDHIDPTQAELRHARLLRGAVYCGLLFQLRGPRLLRTYAIWSEAERRVLFYESTGIRFGETKLANELSWSDAANSSPDQIKHAG